MLFFGFGPFCSVCYLLGGFYNSVALLYGSAVLLPPFTHLTLHTILTQAFAVCLGIYLYYLIVEAQNSKGSKIISRLGKLLVISGFYMCIGLFGVATNPVGKLIGPLRFKFYAEAH